MFWTEEVGELAEALLNSHSVECVQSEALDVAVVATRSSITTMLCSRGSGRRRPGGRRLR